MDDIIYIEFGKSRSSKLKKAVNLLKKLPGHSEEDGKFSVRISEIKDYLIYQDSVNELIEIVKSWKSATVLLYGNQYKTSWDFYGFMDRLESDAGKYAPILKHKDAVSLGAITIESLPLPFVFYPGLYGSFFAFSNDIDGKKYYCECERKAIQNYIRLKRMKSESDFTQNREYYMKLGFPTDTGDVSFKQGICFRCNKKIPKKIYCHLMYGGKFKQHYGWYINQEYYNLGIDKNLFDRMNVLPEECSPELYDTVQRINELIDKRESQIDYYDEITDLRKYVDRAIENSVREQFGYRKIGEAWISETMLYNIVKDLYPEEEIIRHYRPKWLEGLELDIFLPGINLGLEYQGIQHFKAVEHWGGLAQLEKQQEHDERKKRLCLECGIHLVCVNYDEPLESEYIYQKLMDA